MGFLQLQMESSALHVHSKTISNGAQYVTLRKYFSHLSLVMYSFVTHLENQN
jgi:hypothetical protein